MALPTFTEEYRTEDRSEWGTGPWDSEPDKAVWIDEATGLAAMIRRGGRGSLCGYVGLPESHPWHGKGYSECTLAEPCGEDWCDHGTGYMVDVHGGLTFAGACDDEGDPAESICHLAEDGRPVWWFGFDCAHHMDVAPGYAKYRVGQRGTYRTLPYVVAEVSKLAGQLAEVDA